MRAETVCACVCFCVSVAAAQLNDLFAGEHILDNKDDDVHLLYKVVSKRQANQPLCVIPEPPEHGHFRPHRRLCPDGTTTPACTLKPGTEVPNLWILYYVCDAGYAPPTTARVSLCRSGIWKPEPPSTCEVAFTFIKIEEWGGIRTTPINEGKGPFRNVIIKETAIDPCRTMEDCRNFMMDRDIQLGEIRDNFLIAPDGTVFEGSGWYYTHTSSEVQISLIWNLDKNPTPPLPAIVSAGKLIEYGVKLGKIDKEYSLFAYCQTSTFVGQPRNQLLEKVRLMPNWNNLAENQCRYGNEKSEEPGLKNVITCSGKSCVLQSVWS